MLNIGYKNGIERYLMFYNLTDNKSWDVFPENKFLQNLKLTFSLEKLWNILIWVGNMLE